MAHSFGLLASLAVVIGDELAILAGARFLMKTVRPVNVFARIDDCRGMVFRRRVGSPNESIPDGFEIAFCVSDRVGKLPDMALVSELRDMAPSSPFGWNPESVGVVSELNDKSPVDLYGDSFVGANPRSRSSCSIEGIDS